MTQRFFQEAKALSQLSHPHVVSIIDFGSTERGPGTAECRLWPAR